MTPKVPYLKRVPPLPRPPPPPPPSPPLFLSDVFELVVWLFGELSEFRSRIRVWDLGGLGSKVDINSLLHDWCRKATSVTDAFDLFQKNGGAWVWASFRYREHLKDSEGSYVPGMVGCSE